jgi:acyl-CoA thioester hydrolase
MIEVWRGAVETWECDTNAHLNVRFYLAKAMEGLAGGAAALGLPHAFQQGAGATLAVREHHIRYLKEARAGDTLSMSFGVCSMDEDGAVLFLSMAHAESGVVAATFTTRVVHATPLGKAFPWPERVRRLGEGLACEIPETAKPRGVGSGPFKANLADADALNLVVTGRGAVRPEDVDVFGRMRPELVLSRVSSAMPTMGGPLRKAAAEMPGEPVKVGGAAVEMRVLYAEEQPRAGELVEMRSGFSKIGSKAQSLAHWLVDPLSGKGWASVEMVRVNLDLGARKALVLPDDIVAGLQALVRPELV